MPFQMTFESSVEKHYQTTDRTLYDCVVYWYLAPGGEDSCWSVSCVRTGEDTCAECWRIKRIAQRWSNTIIMLPDTSFPTPALAPTPTPVIIVKVVEVIKEV